MKNKFKKTIALVLALVSIFSFEVFASDNSHIYEKKDVILFNGIETNTDNSTRVTGLIGSYYIGVARHGDYMHLVAKVNCIPDVTKCGFKEIIVYRKVTGTTNWTFVRSYEDLYYNGCSHSVEIELQILPNFDYRATCIHYAKKNILMTQTIDDYSNVI